MFRETEFRLENIKTPLIDIDITASNSWVGITGYTEIPYWGDRETLFGTHISFDGRSYKLPKEIRFPRVRSINEETALVFGSSKIYDENNKENAWIIKSDGELKNAFSTAGAVENIVITKDFIVVAYFDEAACYGEGLEIYNFEGKLLFGYEELFSKEAVSIYDCYASALIKDNKIIFCPYTEFPVVIFDIENKTQEIWQLPEGVRGFHAITKLENKIYFHHTYTDRFGIYEWKLGKNELKRIGEYENYFVRGLADGKFLAKTESGYAIISVL